MSDTHTLFGQRHQSLLLHGPLPLNVAGDGECPARAALPLVFDRSNGAMIAPVKGGRDRALWDDGWLQEWVVGRVPRRGQVVLTELLV